MMKKKKGDVFKKARRASSFFHPWETSLVVCPGYSHLRLGGRERRSKKEGSVSERRR